MREKYRHSHLLLFPEAGVQEGRSSHMEAGVLCRFLSRVPVSPVQKTGLPLLKNILPGAHILIPEAVLPALPPVTVLLPVIIQAANLIRLNTGLRPAAIQVQVGPTPPAGPTLAAESLRPVIIQAASLILLNTGLHLAAIQVQAGPTPPAGHTPPVAPLPREDLLFPEGAAGRPVRE